MNRAAWLAAGSIVGALLLPDVPFSALLVLAAALGLTLATLAARRDLPAVGRFRMPMIGVLAGLGLVLCRVIVGIALAVPTDANEPEVTADGSTHEAVVVSIGTPSGGLQRATVDLRPPEPAERVYAWLPRYPAVVIGDVVRFDGRLEPASIEGGFGEFLARGGIEWTTRARSLERIGGDGSPVAALEGIRRQAAEMITRACPSRRPAWPRR